MKIPKSRIIVQHNKNCFAKGKPHEWSGLTDGYFWGTFYAKKSDSLPTHHIWHRVTCNDPDCPAIKAVHSNVLSKA